MFNVGQKVICKDVGNYGRNVVVPGIIKGGIYEVSAIIKCSRCGDELLSLRGFKPDTWKHCIKCWENITYDLFASFRFEPFTYQIIANKEIIGNLLTEKSDIPIIKETIQS